MAKLKRLHALKNTASGAAAEARVAAELARCGLQVAKPYWNDDEIDLLVLWRDGGKIDAVPVQVKSVQALSGKDGNSFITGLKKRYVERLPSLCLAIYDPAKDRIWFIDTAECIRSTYSAQHDWHKHVPYNELTENRDVRIGLNLAETSSRLDRDWLIPRDDAAWLPTRIANVVESLRETDSLDATMEAIFPPYEEDMEDLQDDGDAAREGDLEA